MSQRWQSSRHRSQALFISTRNQDKNIDTGDVDKSIITRTSNYDIAIDGAHGCLIAIAKSETVRLR